MKKIYLKDKNLLSLRNGFDDCESGRLLTPFLLNAFPTLLSTVKHESLPVGAQTLWWKKDGSVALFLYRVASLIYKSNLYYLNINPLFYICVAIIFSQDCDFPLNIVSRISYQAELLNLECLNLLGFSFIICAFDGTFK